MSCSNSTSSSNPLDEPDGLESQFGLMPAALDYGAAEELGVKWDRTFFEVFSWDTIQPSGNTFSWETTDAYILDAQEYGINVLVTIKPFASWDQETCHQDLTAVEGFDSTMGKPCDEDAYKTFVSALVERYDGDGVNDMTGLTRPVRYWEVGNEPSGQIAPLIFFQGSSADFLDLMQMSYEAIKQADSNAIVVQGGMAAVDESRLDFWEPILAGGGGDYFDIANLHSIDYGESLDLPIFKDFLEEYNIDKPFWVTELQLGGMTIENPTDNSMAASLARSMIYALANEASKLFYVQLTTPPGEDSENSAFETSASLIDSNGQPQPIYYAFQTVMQKLDGFTDVEILEEKIDALIISKAKYKFTIDGAVLYVIWGDVDVSGLTGEAHITDCLGDKSEDEIANLAVSDCPLFLSF